MRASKIGTGVGAYDSVAEIQGIAASNSPAIYNTVFG